MFLAASFFSATLSTLIGAIEDDDAGRVLNRDSGGNGLKRNKIAPQTIHQVSLAFIVVGWQDLFLRQEINKSAEE